MKIGNKGFTLIEILIILVILSILSTLSFVSYNKYGSGARDTNRVVTLGEINKGLNLYRSKVGSFPAADEQSNTGVVNGEILSTVGVIGTRISELLFLKGVPLDPVSGNKFVYGVSYDKKYFQIATTTENPVVKNLIPSTYANNNRAKVLGNYDGLIKKSNKIYNLPSLIFTGDGNLLSSNTFFVINNGQNLPYKTSQDIPDNSVVKSDVLKTVTQRDGITLTGIILPQSKENFLANTGTYRQLGYSIEIIGQKLYGRNFVYDGGEDNNIILPGISEEGGSGSYECLEIYEPVCGVDEQTYSSSCHAGKAGVAIASQGPCGGGFGTPPEELY